MLRFKTCLTLVACVSMGALPLAACGGDDSGGGDGGSGCTAHNPCDAGDGGTVIDFDTPVGGQVLFEYINFDDTLAAQLMLPDGVNTVTRSINWFIDDMTPETLKIPEQGSCDAQWMTNDFPSGQGDNITEVDVGGINMIGQNAAGDDVTLEIPKAHPAGADPDTDPAYPDSYPYDNVGLMHQIFWQAIIPNADAQMKPGSSYDVELTGSDTFDPVTYPGAVYLPKAFTLNSPDFNAGGPPPNLTAGQDADLGWQVVTNDAAPMGVPIQQVIFLVDPMTHTAVYVCPTKASDGHFTIPGDVITSYREQVQAAGGNPDIAIVLRNNLTHQLAQLQNNEPDNVRRIDMISIYCYAQFFTTSAN